MNLKLPRCWFLAFVGAHACAACLSDAAAAERRPPNIIWIMADDLGYGELACYGQKLIQTPNLDRMAAEGMRLRQFYAGSTVCAPSRCVLMTGQHMGHCRVRGNALPSDYTPQNLDPENVTVAEVLKKAGYATALVGKWGLGVEGSSAVPTRHGFDFFYGYLDQYHAHNSWPEYLIQNEQRVPLRNKVKHEGKDYEKLGAGMVIEKVDYAPDLMQAQALGWLEAHKDGPFFLYLSPILPHANNELQRATGRGQEYKSLGIYADKDWPEMDKAHAASITLLDEEVGQILALLKKLGLDEQTLVFFTGDNGPQREGGNRPEFFQAAGPLRGIKRDLYEGGIRVPMLARWPGHIAAGNVSDHIGYFGDLMATAAQLSGVPAPPGLDSLSFVPTLLGQPGQKQHEYLYWEFYESRFVQAVRLGDWKGVRFALRQPPELYDLKTDLGETRNVAAQHPDAVKQIEQAMQQSHVDSKYWPIPQGGPAGAAKNKKPRGQK